MWECTPLSESNPMICKADFFFFTCFAALIKVLFLKNDLFFIALFILTKSLSLILPAPIVMWPTSELPMNPFGRPTASPDAFSVVCALVFHKVSRFGVCASLIALPFFAFLTPQPSRIISIRGFAIFSVLLFSPALLLFAIIGYILQDALLCTERQI